MYVCMNSFPCGAAAQRAPHGLIILQVSRAHTRRTTLLWTTDQLVAETSTNLHPTFTTDKHPRRRLY
jgi:hypothetical protein